MITLYEAYTKLSKQSSHSINEAEGKKYALGTLIDKNMKEINSITNKSELIEFVYSLKNQISDETYLTREVLPNLQRKNFIDGLQYIINIALKGVDQGSIENEFGRKSTKRNSRKKVNESQKLTLEQYFTRIKNSRNYEDAHYIADDLEKDYPDARLTWLMNKVAILFQQTYDGPNGPFSYHAICDIDIDLYETLTESLKINVDYYISIISDLYDELDDLNDDQAEEFDAGVVNVLQRLWKDIKNRIWYYIDYLIDDDGM